MWSMDRGLNVTNFKSSIYLVAKFSKSLFCEESDGREIFPVHFNLILGLPRG